MGRYVVANSRLYSYSLTSTSTNKVKIDGSIQKIHQNMTYSIQAETCRNRIDAAASEQRMKKTGEDNRHYCREQ